MDKNKSHQVSLQKLCDIKQAQAEKEIKTLHRMAISRESIRGKIDESKNKEQQTIVHLDENSYNSPELKSQLMDMAQLYIHQELQLRDELQIRADDIESTHRTQKKNTVKAVAKNMGIEKLIKHKLNKLNCQKQKKYDQLLDELFLIRSSRENP